MAKNGVTLDVSGLVRLASAAANLSQRQIDQVRSRSIATLRRRIVPEAARQISSQILNLPSRVISSYLALKSDERGITVTGKNKRPSLSDFGAKWGGPSSPGVTVTIWRDKGPELIPHGFMRPGSKEVWQRIPSSRSKTQLSGVGRDSSRAVVQAAGALVGRLPIVVRKGPAMARAVYERKHGDIYPDLTSFAQTVLATEVARLVASIGKS